MKISIKRAFFISTTICFIFLKKIWDLTFDVILPPLGNITFLLHLIGLVILILPVSIILTYFLFNLVKRNWQYK